jgi:hypothetical protein
MFDGVARRYDLTNTVLTAGQDRRWRALARRALALQPGEIVLDLAAGTAVSTVELARSGAVVRGGRLLARHAPRGSGAPGAEGRRRRARPAVRGRRVRRRHDRVRPAQRARHRTARSPSSPA